MRDKALKTSLWGVNFDVEGEQCILMFSQTFTAFLVEIIFSCWHWWKKQCSPQNFSLSLVLRMNLWSGSLLPFFFAQFRSSPKRKNAWSQVRVGCALFSIFSLNILMNKGLCKKRVYNNNNSIFVSFLHSWYALLLITYSFCNNYLFLLARALCKSHCSMRQ